ncbi:hypothetical protein GCM10027280_00120 [Micromonospora polyrhachis]|uniref:AbiEi antitoxin N-terminal domain-containing protein n=1 Tax=Micromonospora polyrhachis TaxID=1282883 RepID=A0A7W7WNJ4_9ACTN|nr:type IV toxin-antitoxin system AbiEi family antitoxin domain-containing protein [Micromonospora polyrhachis]MBB4957692.1 hypothetical protein [Micromonospora polyrhachis]
MWNELAGQQQGVLSRAQCQQIGITDEMVYRRIASNRWQQLFVGVYATFSGPIPRAARLWATLLYAGDGAVLSHESAAELVGLLDQPVSPVHVTIPAHRRVRPATGVVVHRAARVPLARHPTRLPPQTRVEETVLDLTQSARQLDDALSWLARACGRRLTTPSRIGSALRLRPRVRWRAELLAALDDVADGCHSLLELRYLHDVERRHGLPIGRRQSIRLRRGGRWYDDIRYDDFATLVELDGRVAHPAESRARDRRRDNSATAEGLSVLRYDLADVFQQPCAAAAQVAATLRRNGWPGRPTRCGSNCSIKRLTD